MITSVLVKDINDKIPYGLLDFGVNELNPSKATIKDFLYIIWRWDMILRLSVGLNS